MSKEKCAENITEEQLMKLYLEARNDYRASLSLEQTILNFCIAVLAMCVASGFVLFGQMASWIIFCIVIPFFLSLAKLVYIHQKHRSKTYKKYQEYLENILNERLLDFPGFELWKKDSISSFVNKRSGFKFGYIAFFVLVPYLFMVIGVFSYKAELVMWMFFCFIVLVNILTDIVGFQYIRSIKSILVTYKTKKLIKNEEQI